MEKKEKVKKTKKVEDKKPSPPPKKIEKEFDGMELAKAMGIHFADLDTIMYRENLKPGFKITTKKLNELYNKIIGRR